MHWLTPEINHSSVFQFDCSTTLNLDIHSRYYGDYERLLGLYADSSGGSSHYGGSSWTDPLWSGEHGEKATKVQATHSNNRKTAAQNVPNEWRKVHKAARYM